MDNLNLPDPKQMDVAVPANLRQGLSQDEIEARGWSLTCAEAEALLGGPEIVLVDLRDRAERARHGEIPGSAHAPYPELDENLCAGGLLHELAAAAGKRLVFYCAYGERSAMAVQAAQEVGLTNACHIKGGLDAWKKADGPVKGGGG
jgi:rhodanese-related sulfurtransferase